MEPHDLVCIFHSHTYMLAYTMQTELTDLDPMQVKKYEEQHGSNKSTYWVTFELMWRDYFR